MDNQRNTSSSSAAVGTSIMERSGWVDGKGLGKDGKGTTTHVKSVKKDDMLGVGFKEKSHGQTCWSAHSVGFADVLKRIGCGEKESTGDKPDSSNADEKEDEEKEQQQPSVSSPTGGRHSKMYSKVIARRTEGLMCERGRREALGKRSRSASPDANEDSVCGDRSTLNSEILRRLMVRVKSDEHPLRDGNEAVSVIFPEPRPARCTISPFLT